MAISRVGQGSVMKNLYLFFLLMTSHNLWAKPCTEQTEREAIASKKEFIFLAQDCDSNTIYFSEGIELKGNVLIDGGNKLKLSWTGEGSQCDEFPRNSKFSHFYTSGDNNVLKNFTIILSPEGIHLNSGKNNLIDNVKFDRICEDAITNGNKKENSATNSIIRNSVFKNGPDKAIQCNGGSVTVEGSHFENIPRSIGACSTKADPGFHAAAPCPIACHIKAIKNTVIGCKGYGFRSAGKKEFGANGTLVAIENHFKDCSPAVHASEDGYTYADKNKSTGKCKVFASTIQFGEISLCQNKHQCKGDFSGENILEKCF